MTQFDVPVDSVIGQKLVDTDGDKIGGIEDVYMDAQTGRPEWFAVKTGLFGTRVSFVPTVNAYRADDGFAVPYTKSHVKDAPRCEPDGALSEDEEATLYDHYGLRYSEQRSSSGLPEGQTGRSTYGKSASAGGTSDAAMTRSEEELVAGKRQQATGRARLVKYVETEHRNVTVPIQRERARLVTEPITGENRDEAMSGADIRDNVHEETLYEEEPVVEKRAVPKERVRLEKDTDVEEREVGADLRKEKIRTEGDVDERTKRS
jgi:stress response protein YsnF